MSDFDGSDAFAGLSPKDWYILRDIALAAGYDLPTDPVPEYLRAHPAGRLLHQHAASPSDKLLNQAAWALCPLDPDQAWLALEKS